MISRYVIYCDHYPDGTEEAGSNARERKPATVSHESDIESAKSLNSTDPLSPAWASPPALSISRLSIQLKSSPKNRGIPGNVCLHKFEKNSDLPLGSFGA